MTRPVFIDEADVSRPLFVYFARRDIQVSPPGIAHACSLGMADSLRLPLWKPPAWRGNHDHVLWRRRRPVAKHSRLLRSRVEKARGQGAGEGAKRSPLLLCVVSLHLLSKATFR